MIATRATITTTTFISKIQTIYDDNLDVFSETNLDSCESWLRSRIGEYIVLDIETTGLDPYTSKPILLQLGTQDTQFVIDLRSNYDLSKIKLLLESDKILVIGTNIGFDYKMLKHHHNIILNTVYDIARVDEVLYNGVFSELDPLPIKHKMQYMAQFSLASLCKRYLKTDINKETRNSFIGKGDTTPYTTDEIIYAANDCVYPDLIAEKQADLISKYNLSSCVDLENSVVLAIADMELNGIGFNKEPWTANALKLRAELDELDYQLDAQLLDLYGMVKYRMPGKQLNFFEESVPERLTIVNWASDAQVLEVLQDCKFPITATDKKSLDPHASSVIIRNLLKRREVSKAVTTYGLSFLKWINPITGRIHPRFLQLFTDTGRLSCESPNLQNIKRGSDYRKCFVARPGYSLIGADYKSQELRIIAHTSQDPLWLEVFSKGLDLHTELCMKTFNISEETVKHHFPGAQGDTTYRDVQKTINFG